MIPRARLALSVILITILIQLVWGCDYARMKEDEAIRHYETSIPEMPQGTIPVNSVIHALLMKGPGRMTNALPPTRLIAERGRKAYGHFCVMCHGPRGDGHGTVGQSFAPLPTDLNSPYVQGQSDGVLFYRISLGYKKHPPLAYTVSEEDGWAIIEYIRFVAPKS
jgi:hypothetical protein